MKRRAEEKTKGLSLTARKEGSAPGTGTEVGLSIGWKSLKVILKDYLRYLGRNSIFCELFTVMLSHCEK